MEHFFSINEAAKALGVHPNTIRNWIKTGVLRAYRPNPKRGSKVFIRESDIFKSLLKGMIE